MTRYICLYPVVYILLYAQLLNNLSAFNLQGGDHMTVQEWWFHLRSQLPGAKRKGFDTLFTLVAWQLWKERNARLCVP